MRTEDDNTEDDNIDEHYVSSDLDAKRRRGELLEMKTTDGKTVYLDISDMDAAEIKAMRDTDLEIDLSNGKANMVPKKKRSNR